MSEQDNRKRITTDKKSIQFNWSYWFKLWLSDPKSFETALRSVGNGVLKKVAEMISKLGED